MPRRLLALIFGVAMLAPGGMATAADLPSQSRLGAIFAEPVVPRVGVERSTATRFVYAPEVDIRPLVNGYYGKPKSYDYQSYYGTSPVKIFSRLPYACGFVGYC